MRPWLPPQRCWPFAAELRLRVWFQLVLALLLQIGGVLSLQASKHYS
jgi:hypothetical protein